MSQCPHCGDNRLIKYSSLRKQQCSKCGSLLPWELKPGQKPLVTNNRDKRKDRDQN